MPILSTIVKGSFAELSKSHSPKSIIIAPSCKTIDRIYKACISYIGHVSSLKHAIHIRRAYNITYYSPHVDLWNPTDILITTPAALTQRIRSMSGPDTENIYFTNTCYIIILSLGDLMRMQRSLMVELFAKLKLDLQVRVVNKICVHEYITAYVSTFHMMYPHKLSIVAAKITTENIARALYDK